jgi:hypothetical protein
MRSLKFLQKPEVLYLLVGLAVIIIAGVVYFTMGKHGEGFAGYPLTQARIEAGEVGMRRYNDFTDTQDVEKINVIPEMTPGDELLNGALDTPSYEPDSTMGSMQGLNYNNERKYMAPPQIPILLQRIKRCESLRTWDCQQLSDPEFAKYCGICSKRGLDHLGQPHIGGMYIDPDRKQKSANDAAKSGKPAVYSPTFGTCKGEFLVTRPYCDVQRDRDDCKNATSLSDPTTASKCGMCVATNQFVYLGSRGGAAENYALSGNPVKHTVRLRIGVSHPKIATVTVKRVADGSNLRGSFSRGSPNVYLLDIRDTFEGEQFTISVKYPDWQDYAFTPEELSQITAMSAPPRAPLVRAAYGPNIGDYSKDSDDGAKDVTDYVQSKFKMLDCSNTAVRATNDGLGGDPYPGIYKQLRLAYSSDGSNFAYAYASEGEVSQPVVDDNFRALCPQAISPDAAKTQVCEVLPGGTDTPTGRAYVNPPNPSQYFGSTGKSPCVAPAPKVPRGIVGTWSSINNNSRVVPLDLSVRELNGLTTTVDGISKYGTLAGSAQFKRIAPATTLAPIPPYLFWFWGRDSTASSCTLLVTVPAVFRDPTVRADIAICPAGPISTTAEGSKNLQAGVCEKYVNGKPQGPGTYTDDCIRSLYIQGGCSTSGKAYPNSPATMAAVRKDPMGRDLDADGVIGQVSTNLFGPASSGLDQTGQQLDIDTYAKANMDCFGKAINNVCDTAFKETGPLTPACLDYLFKNAGKDNPTIGSTYPNVYNRSSGTDRTAWSPIMYCQRTGTMAPIGADGKLNMEAIQTANSKGGVSAVRDFYRQIHYDANFNMDRNQQKANLQKCYGVDVVDAAKPCPPLAPRLVDIGPPNAGSVQNPNVIPNIGGPSWGQGLVSSTVMPDGIVPDKTYTVGATKPITFKTVYRGTYNNEQAYRLGNIIEHSDGVTYMNLAWPDQRGPAYSGTFRDPPNPRSKAWMKVPPIVPPAPTNSGKKLRIVSNGDGQFYENNKQIVVEDDNYTNGGNRRNTTNVGGGFPSGNAGVGLKITGPGVPPGTIVTGYRMGTSNPSSMANVIFMDLNKSVSGDDFYYSK